MEYFPHGMHVWLRNVERDGYYLCAGADGVSVYLNPNRASRHAAWLVDRVAAQEQGGGGGGAPNYLLLRSAAYGRYLGLTADEDDTAYDHGLRAVQRAYESPDDLDFLRWLPVRAAHAEGVVRLRLFGSNACLRANGRNRPWRLDVTIEDRNRAITMKSWSVLHIPARAEPPPLPPPTVEFVMCRGLLYRVGPVVLEDRRRTIRYFWVDDETNVFVGTFDFYGRSVFNLRTAAAQRINEPNPENIRLWVYAGVLGYITRLVDDLPNNDDRFDIIVTSVRLPTTVGMRHPDVHAAAPLPLPPPQL